MNITTEALMNAWLGAALVYWRETIRDDDGGVVGDRDEIGRMFERAAPWALSLMGGKYHERHDASAWCGHFQSNCGFDVGEHLSDRQCLPVWLDHDIASKCLASTRRMVRADRWLAAGYTADENDGLPSPPREVDTTKTPIARLEELLAIPRVATVASRTYGDKRDRVGGHFVLVESVDFDAGTFTTVEGNGRGELGDGKRGEGVIRRRGKNARKLDELRRLYLFTLDHFEFGGRP